MNIKVYECSNHSEYNLIGVIQANHVLKDGAKFTEELINWAEAQNIPLTKKQYNEYPFTIWDGVKYALVIYKKNSLHDYLSFQWETPDTL